MAGLYVHIPFCQGKCPYCDFFSLAGAQHLLPQYSFSLSHHLRQWAQSGKPGESLATVFFGGGTPSLLEPKAVGAVLEEADRLFGLESAAEITLEANPGTLSLEKLHGYRSAGVNRLSLGVQSFAAENLSFLGRLHRPGDIKESIIWARRAGFDNLGFDLMFGFYGQTHRAFLGDLQRAVDLAPQHLSLYGLTVEAGTPFAELEKGGRLLVGTDEKWAAMFREADDFLGHHGFCHYEISNYAQPGRDCRHNLVYWRRLPYIGIGAGAHSFFASGWGERWAAPDDLGHYFSRLAEGENPSLRLEGFSREQAMRETLYLGLRTAEGVSEADFQNHFGSGVAAAFPRALQHLGKNVHKEEGRWRMTLEGWLIYDHLIQEFF
ncbi:MAG: radical SAM family heme chaperone HemW [Desulfuromonadaceae bacterium]|nr:radical SAM family heme chaperone HemW [Desulfuromonadaceae bacterium]